MSKSGAPSPPVPHILLVEARYYPALSDGLKAGAIAALKAANARWSELAVAGALEIPAAIRIALDGETPYDGYVALGAVIRGETAHFDIVAQTSAHALMQLAVLEGAAIGNGILTVENEAQALERADPKGRNCGGAAADACLGLVRARAQLQPSAERLRAR